MKRRIAVFAGGWGGEYFREVVLGIVAAAKQENADVFAFVNFSVHADTIAPNIGEFNIFTLPDLKDFDGVILMANSFNMLEEVEYLTNKIKKAGIPAVSIEYDIDGFVSVATDNYAGMYDLAKHVIEEHGGRDILFIGGPKEHPESAERLRALTDAAAENGFIIPDENIKYADWSKDPAIQLVTGWMDKHGKLPDAVVCANDIMAMGICEHLMESGYNVPEDVIITGYDCLSDARSFHPTITTVNHEWGKMGETAMRMMAGLLKGENVENAMLKTTLVIGESCGCTGEDEYNDSKLHSKSLKQKYEMDGLVMDSHFRHIYQAVRKVDGRDGLFYSLSYLFECEHAIEGEDFMLCLDPEFFHLEDNDLNLRSQGYSDKLDIICQLNKGISRPLSTMGQSEALFAVSEHKEETGLYMFVPIYSDTKTYGFAMLTGDLHIACGNQLYIWTRHMNQDLEQARRNITIAELTRKLTQLSVTDVLTGIYNRAGCEKLAFPMLEEWRQGGGTGVVMLVDIDKMKTINDNYGHAYGDLALCTVASVLRKELPSDWIVSRFGGDEFFIGGKILAADMDFNVLKDTLEKSLAEEVKRRGITFCLTVSIGIVLVKPEDRLDIEKYLQMADVEMYNEKKEHHRRIENAE